jgi:DNA-binding XRE family transcriptional regulator
MTALSAEVSVLTYSACICSISILPVEIAKQRNVVKRTPVQKPVIPKPKLPGNNQGMALKKEKLLEVGNNIRKWRMLKGIKQELMAEELEISKVSVSKIETGKTDIPLNRLFQIASVLGIKIQLLFSDPYIILQESEKITG